MERRMEAIEVFLNKGGTISLSQHREHDEPAIITIHPDQVDIVMKWLQDAKAEIMGDDRE